MLTLKGVLLLVAILIVGGTATKSLKRNVTCQDETREIPISAFCDGVRDCADGTDENYLGKGFKCQINGKRKCVLPQELVADVDVTYCHNDLDHCFDQHQRLIGSNCFRCLDNKHVIAVTQVCDSIIDCEDLSDECLCQNNAPVPLQANKMNPICAHVCMASEEGLDTPNDPCTSCRVGDVICSLTNGTSSCVKPHQVCDGMKDCPNGEDELYCIKDVLCDGNQTIATSCDDVITCGDFTDECASQCWQNSSVCDHVIDGGFQCTAGVSDRLPSDQVCDSVIDCYGNGTDEKGCSTSDHFYCWKGDVLFVNWSQRYDGVRDCQYGSDECPSLFHMTLSTTYAYNDQVIRNPFLLTIVWILLVPALFGNIVVIVMTSQELWKDRHADKLGRLAKCNRTFVLNLAFADLLMGIYLLMLGVQNVMYYDSFCVHDRNYRTSRVCTAMGILTQVSAQTSVFILLLMTSYRLYGTLQPFRVEESRLIGGAATLASISWITSIVVAFTPQARVLNDYFVVSYWLPASFLNFDFVNKSQMKKLVLGIHTLSVNSSTNSTLPALRWKTMIEYVNNLNLPMIYPSWGDQYVVPIGFYNQFSTCQPFFYPDAGDTAWLYMASIIAFNFLAFVYIFIAYLVIYKKSSKPMVRKSVRRRSRQWRRDNRTMQKKIMCLVMTDLACWLPVCIIFIVRISGHDVHPIVHGLTGTVLLPINSAVNPIIYSNAITNLKNVFKKKMGYVDSNSSDASDAARLYVGRHSSKASLDINGSIKSTSSIGNLLAADSPNNRRVKNGNAAMRKKKSNGFVRPHVTFAASSHDDVVDQEKYSSSTETNKTENTIVAEIPDTRKITFALVDDMKESVL